MNAPPAPNNRGAFKGWLVAAIVAGVLYWSALGTHFSGPELSKNLPAIGEFFRKLFPSEGKPWPTEALPEITKRLIETFRIAIAASLFGALLALPLPLIAARNLAGKALYTFGRAVLNLIRSVPDLVLATLLAASFGIGPLAGFLALLVFSFGVVGKLLCDSVETIDPGPREAVAAAGGTRLQQAFCAVFPQVGPDYLAYTLYSFEINIRAASVLGVVGAGGIGMVLQSSLSLLQYTQVGLVILITFAVVFLIDSFSTWVRGKLV